MEENPLLCFVGDQKFWILPCVHGGIKNSESTPVFMGGSEILNPLLCSLGGSEILNPLQRFVRDQKFWILSCVHGADLFRNSESSPVFCGDHEFWILSCFHGGSEILNPLTRFLWGKLSRHQIQKIIWKLLGGILWFLANRETFPVNFNTILRFRVNYKEPSLELSGEVAIMNFRGSSTFYFLSILH